MNEWMRRAAALLQLGCATLAPIAAADELPTIPLQAPAQPPEPSRVDEEPVALETVIVTGELLAREADQTVSSVAVVSGREIERSTARDVYDVIRATPNAGLEDSDYGVGGMTLRGIGSYGASGSGAYAAYSTTSVVVLDGLGLPRSALAYADLSAFDLDTVEIFRGPQSTSQGRNAMAGAVIINSVAPEPMPAFLAPQLRGRFAGGDQGTHQYAGAAEATLWPQLLGLRLVHDDRADDGDISNATRGEDDAARRDSRSTRLRARLQPGGQDGRYHALLSAADVSRYQGSSYVPLQNEQSRVALSDAPQDFENQAQLYTLDQRLRLGEAWDLRAVSGWFDSETFSRFDTDYGAESDGATEQREDSRGFSQELRLTYGGERVRGTLGAYYYDEDNGDRSTGFISVDSLISIVIPPFCSLFPCTGALGNVVFDSGSPSEVKDMALFGELDWSATDRLTLTAGLRADREENSRVISSYYDGDTATARLLIGALQGSVFPPDGSVAVSREFSELLPKLAARYELFDGWYLGAAYAEGYRPGGDGYNQVSGRYFSFDSERTRNTELSFKGSYRPWRLQAAVNLFHTRWEDMQIQLGSGVDNYMGNAGPANLRGGELELHWKAHRSLQVVGGYGVTWGRFGDDVVVADETDLSGKRLPKAPKYTGSLALEWNPWRSLLIRPDVVWVGAAASDAVNNPVHGLPAYQLVNLALRWRSDRFGLFFAGTNLADENYRRDANSYNTSGTTVVSLGEGRRLIGGLEFQF